LDIKFIPEAEKDYKSLDGNIKKLVNEKIDNLKDNAYAGEERCWKKNKKENNVNMMKVYAIGLILIVILTTLFYVFSDPLPIQHYYRNNAILLFFSWCLYFLWIILSIIILINILNHNINIIIKLLLCINAIIIIFSIMVYTYIFIYNKGSNLIFYGNNDDIWLIWYNIFNKFCIISIINISVMNILTIIYKKYIGIINISFVVINSILTLIHILSKIPEVT
jgi:hypothetical protein